jgi:hypothetical protein
MIAAGRLTEAMIPDDFRWLIVALGETERAGGVDRSIADLLGEALRRRRHGQMRPLWADMPEGEMKAAWRRLGLRWLEAEGARNAALEAAARIVDEAAAAVGGGTPSKPGVVELRDAGAKIRALISNPVPLKSEER